MYIKQLYNDNLRKLQNEYGDVSVMQDQAQDIVKWHFSSVEALPSSKFWKSENGPTSWTEWNIVMKFCIHIDIDMT